MKMEMKDVIFWNVDTQKDFILQTGKLYINGAERIFANLFTLTQFATKKNIKVINTADYHTKNTKEISSNPDFKITFPEHCMAGTEGMEFISATNPTLDKNYCIIGYEEILNATLEALVKQKRNIVIHKDSFDVFVGNPHTESILDILKPKIIVVYGVATDVCVDFAVKGLLAKGLLVIVIEDAIKGLSEDNCKIALENWAKNGALLTDTIDLEDTLKEELEE